jgi:hypothetical protein
MLGDAKIADHHRRLPPPRHPKPPVSCIFSMAVSIGNLGLSTGYTYSIRQPHPLLLYHSVMLRDLEQRAAELEG